MADYDFELSPPAPQLHDTLRLSADGFAKVLGDLEARVMRTVWAMPRPGTARDVHALVVHEHDVALATVTTVLNKLCDKGLLRRDKQDGLLHYQPAIEEEELRVHVSRRVVEGVLSLGPDAVTASFVDVLARDPERLARLGRLIAERLREQGADPDTDPVP